MCELTEDVKFSLKVMMNKQKTKVLFAEADSSFAQIILSFLTLPLGEIVRIMKKHYGDEVPVFGSLHTLYTSLSNLDEAHFWTDGGKKMLLNPRNSFSKHPIKCFRCSNMDCTEKGHRNMSIYYDSGICDCGEPLSRAMDENFKACGESIFVNGLHFIVTDDLRLAPLEPGLMIQTFIDFGIVVTEGAELWNVTLGYNEMVDLLKGSLLSKTPLTDTILLFEKQLNCIVEDFHLLNVPPSTNFKRMTVTVLIQRSTSKLLFVEAKEDFVDFILGFLIIPLGRVESLLGGKTSLKSIDNLFNSTTNLIKDEHFITKHTKQILLEPPLPHFYVSKNHIFALTEKISPPINQCVRITDSSNRIVENSFGMCYKDLKGDEGCYVKKPGNFMVSDDLTVIPLSLCSRAFVCSELGIPSSDVKEIEVPIGLKEGLSILRASLTSTSALTDGLLKPIMKIAPPLIKAEVPWSARRGTLSEKERVLKTIKGLLNKLMPENFDRLKFRLIYSGITTVDILKDVVCLIFDKAVLEPKFCPVYALLCSCLNQSLPPFPSDEPGEREITFKRVLLNICQEAFEGANNLREEARQMSAPEQESERRDKERLIKIRALGNIRLIGELYMQRIITEMIAHHIVRELLGPDTESVPEEENVEAIFHIFNTIGKRFDGSQRSKEINDIYFNRLKDLSTNPQLAARLRFMLLDILDLRSNNWIPRREEVRKKLVNLHGMNKKYQSGLHVSSRKGSSSYLVI